MLKRDLGKWDIVLLMLNTIIGAGIYGLPSKLYSLTGIYSLVVLAICAVIIFVYILIFAEVSSQFDRSGGPYLYIFEAFGKTPGFIVGWLMLISRVSAFAALINLLVDYLSYVSPVFIDQQIRIIAIILLSLILFGVNAVSVKSSAYLSNLLGVAKLIPLLFFVLVGFFFIDIENLAIHTHKPDFSSFSSAMFIGIFAFTAWEASLVNTGEMANPKKNIPFAMIVTISFAAIFYILIQLTAIGTYPELATSIKPIADAANLFIGPVGGAFITLGAAISIMGTLNANLLAGSRLPLALSEEGQLPKIFERTHEKTGVPFISLVLYTLVAIAVSVSGTFIYALSINVVSKVLIYMLVAIALIKLRAKNHPKTFQLPYGKTLSILGIIIGAWLLYSSDHSDFIDVLITISIGVVLFFLFKRKSK